jgi:hypothetical protein
MIAFTALGWMAMTTTALGSGACEPTAPVDDTIQVAWIAPKAERVRKHTVLEVVRVSDLRAWVSAKNADPLRTLQGLGMVGRNVQEIDGTDWTISLFDVKVTWLCRPIQGETPGTAVVGVAACVEDQQVALDEGHTQGFTGCGYTLDMGASNRGLDIFRLDWETAVSNGFCLWPLERFLEGP